MVIVMNKRGFIQELSKALDYSEEKCNIINNILETNFFISKKSKGKIVEELRLQLEISEKEAERIYLVAIEILKRELKKKMLHPFRSKD